MKTFLPRRPRRHAPQHLAWLRTLPSLVPGDGPIEAAHIRFTEARYPKRQVGMGEKPDDVYAVPLAAGAHRKQHSMNEQAFWKEQGINPIAVALCLWAHSGEDESGLKIVRMAREISR